MTPDEARAFLKDHHNAVLATFRRDGRPQLSVVGATVDEQGRVIISTRRRKRPNDFRIEPSATLGGEFCPFCAGHEAHTTPTIDQIERDGRWVARSFANRRPAVALEGIEGVVRDGIYERTGGIGAHEVIVEAPEHAPLHTLPVERTIESSISAVSPKRSGSV